MSTQIELIYPTLNLFLYGQREGLGQDRQKVGENRKEFWQRVYRRLQQNALTLEKQDEILLLQLEEAEKSGVTPVELLGSERVKPFERRPLDGYYCPLLIGDTYALQVN